MQGDGESLGFNISSVANQRMPTNTALILCRVESLLLRHINNCPLKRHDRIFSRNSPALRESTRFVGARGNG